MSGRYLFYLTTLLALTSLCLGQHTFNCPPQPLCSGQVYTATCGDVPIDTLSWELVDNNGMTVASLWPDDYYDTTNSSLLNTISWGGVEISFYQENDTSIIANFTTSPVLDGFWLKCNATNANNMTFDANCSINVTTVTMPQNISLDFTTITDNSIVVNWDSWTDDCLQWYLINITANNSAWWWNGTIPGTQQNFTIWRPDLHLSTVYRLTVTPIGYAGPNTDRTANARPIIFDVPLQVTNIRDIHMPILETTPVMTPINVTIRWDAMFTFRPRTFIYYIRHNATRHRQMMSSGSGSGMDNDDQTDFTDYFPIRIPRGQMGNMANVVRLNMGARVGDTYTIYVKPSNVLGNGTVASYTFTLQYEPPAPTPTPSIVLPSASTPSITMSPSVVSEGDTGLQTWAIAVIAVGVGIFAAIIVAVIVIVAIVLFCICSSAARKQEEHEMTEGTKL